MNSDILSFLLFLLVSKAAFSQHHQEEHVSEHLQTSVFSYPPFLNSTFPQPPGPTKLGSLLCFCWLKRCLLFVLFFIACCSLFFVGCSVFVVTCLSFAGYWLFIFFFGIFHDQKFAKSVSTVFFKKCFFVSNLCFFCVDFVWD